MKFGGCENAHTSREADMEQRCSYVLGAGLEPSLSSSSLIEPRSGWPKLGQHPAVVEELHGSWYCSSIILQNSRCHLCGRRYAYIIVLAVHGFSGDP